MDTLKTDYHIHTRLCRHAEGDMEAYVRRAVELGFHEIGFSDHAPVQDGYDPQHRMDWHQFSGYTETIRALRIKYPRIQIRLGVEADVYPGFEDSLRTLIRSFPVDYVIGSVHFIDGDPVFMRDAESLSDTEIQAFITEYFSRLILGVQSGLFDVIAHLDVIKWNYADHMDCIRSQAERLLTGVQKAGLAIELNTSGLRKKPGQTYPDFDILQTAAHHHIPVIPGSDAHEPGHVGADFAQAKEMLEQAGYSQIFRYRPALLACRV